MESASDFKGSSCQEDTKVAATRSKSDVNSKHYLHIHYYEKTKRWGTWVRCAKTKKRLYLGTHESQHLAARCQDRANLKLKNLNGATSLNFCERDYDEDNEMREKLSDEDFVKFLRAESRGQYKRMEKSLCLQKFIAQERGLNQDEPSSQGRQNNPCNVTSFVDAAPERTSLSRDLLKNPAESYTRIGPDVLQRITKETHGKLRVLLPPPFTGIPKRPRYKIIKTPRVARSGTVGCPVSDSTFLHNTGPSGVQKTKRSAGMTFMSLERILAKDNPTLAQPLVQATLKSTCFAVEPDKFNLTPAVQCPLPVAATESRCRTKSNASDFPKGEGPLASMPAKLRLKAKGIQTYPDLSKRCGAAPAVPKLRSAEKKPVHTFKNLNAFKAKGYSLDVLAAFALAFNGGD